MRKGKMGEACWTWVLQELTFLPWCDQQDILATWRDSGQFLNRRSKAASLRVCDAHPIYSGYKWKVFCFHKLIQHILKTLVLSSFVRSPFFCIICDVLALLQTGNLAYESFETGKVGPRSPLFPPHGPSASQPSPARFPRLPLLPEHLPGSEWTGLGCSCVCLLCFKPLCR